MRQHRTVLSLSQCAKVAVVLVPRLPKLPLSESLLVLQLEQQQKRKSKTGNKTQGLAYSSETEKLAYILSDDGAETLTKPLFARWSNSTDFEHFLPGTWSAIGNSCQGRVLADDVGWYAEKPSHFISHLA